MIQKFVDLCFCNESEKPQYCTTRLYIYIYIYIYKHTHTHRVINSSLKTIRKCYICRLGKTSSYITLKGNKNLPQIYTNFWQFWYMCVVQRTNTNPTYTREGYQQLSCTNNVGNYGYKGKASSLLIFKGITHQWRKFLDNRHILINKKLL
jgi:hypothetical protein